MISLASTAEATGSMMQPPPDSQLFLLQIETEWDRSVPMHPPREEDYHLARSQPGILISLSRDGFHAWINLTAARGEQVLLGTFRDQVPGVRTFDVECWAGGVLVLTDVGEVIRAELTLYGSGVPVISSVRGPLKAMDAYPG